MLLLLLALCPSPAPSPSTCKQKRKCKLFTHGALGVHMNSLEMPVHSRTELEFGNVWFLRRGKPEYPEKYLLEQSRDRTNNKLNPHMTQDLGVEPGPHWWEASTLTTAPFLLPTLPSSQFSRHQIATQANNN